MIVKSKFAPYNEIRGRKDLLFWNFVLSAHFRYRDVFRHCKELVYSQNAEGRETRDHKEYP